MLVVNLFAGPGAGKSTLAAGVFYQLKCTGVNCELVAEFAKELAWEEASKTINNTLYVFANQHNRLFRLKGMVDVAVMDSPLLLSLAYIRNSGLGKNFADLVLSEFNKFENLNYFVKRKDTYSSLGRFENEQEARKKDQEVTNLLDLYGIIYTEVGGEANNNSVVESIVAKVKEVCHGRSN